MHASQVIVEHKAVQACLDGSVPLAQLRDGAEAAPESLEPARSLPPEPVSRTASHLRLLRGAARLVGLNAAARRHALQAQLTRLLELRQDVVRKMNSKSVKDSLRELRKYRRPPRAAAQVPGPPPPAAIQPHAAMCCVSCSHSPGTLGSCRRGMLHPQCKTLGELCVTLTV